MALSEPVLLLLKSKSIAGEMEDELQRQTIPSHQIDALMWLETSQMAAAPCVQCLVVNLATVPRNLLLVNMKPLCQRRYCPNVGAEVQSSRACSSLMCTSFCVLWLPGSEMPWHVWIKVISDICSALSNRYDGSDPENQWQASRAACHPLRQVQSVIL